MTEPPPENEAAFKIELALLLLLVLYALFAGIRAALT